MLKQWTSTQGWELEISINNTLEICIVGQKISSYIVATEKRFYVWCNSCSTDNEIAAIYLFIGQFHIYRPYLLKKKKFILKWNPPIVHKHYVNIMTTMKRNRKRKAGDDFKTTSFNLYEVHLLKEFIIQWHLVLGIFTQLWH